MRSSVRHDLDYLAVCDFTAQRFSTCLRRQYCAVIVGADGRLVGFGYNGSPPSVGHCMDGHCPRARGEVAHGSSYDNCIAVHAEQNALLFSDRTARQGGTLYVNGPPCWDCGKLIAGSGIQRVVGITDPAYEMWGQVRGLLLSVGLRVVMYDRSDVEHSGERTLQ